MPRNPLRWNPATERYERPIGKQPTRNPFKGLVGHKGRRRSFADDMYPLSAMKAQPVRTGLTGAEKRRKRKGGNPRGGPGGGGIQGSMRRLKASIDKKDPKLRGHMIGKGFA